MFRHEIESYIVSDSQAVIAGGIVNGKFGSGRTEKMDKATFPFLADRIVKETTYNEKPEVGDIFPGAEKYHKHNVFNPNLCKTPISDKLSLIKKIEDAIYAADPRVADCEVSFSERGTESEFYNSYGLKLKEKSNYFYIGAEVVMREGEETKTGYSARLANDLSEFESEAFVKELTESTGKKFGAKSIRSGKYPTLIDREVMSSLIDYFLSSAIADEVQRHSSMLEGKLNAKIASSKLTIEEKPLTKNIFFSYFDDEGVATQNKVIVKNGVLKQYFYNRETAKKDGVETTGNGSWGGGRIGTTYGNVFVKPGKIGKEELIADIKDGVYIDDGWSGGNFDRPGWKQLIADIEAGKVERVIVKDMSRVGRDYLQTGFYTEVFFRQHHIHFIAIANNVDSEDEASNEFTPFFNIMNEWYLRDQSRKVAAAYKVKGNAGKPTTNSAIYGYIKDPEDKDHWLVDEEAAAVVRRIFRLAAEGHGPYEISRMLTAEKVECPGYYLAVRGRGQWKNRLEQLRPHDWFGQTVLNILAKPEYAGHTVNFRSSKKSYKDKRVRNDPEDWVTFKNTHEAIVDQETWDLAQAVAKTRRRTDTTGVANPLTGLVFCADCGAKMYNHRARLNPKTGKRSDTDNYNCSTYTLNFEHETQQCFSHNVTTKALRTLIQETIRKTSKYAIENEEEFRARIQQESEIQQANAAKELKRKVEKARQRSTELDTLVKTCYESFALGKMPEKRYEMLSADYEKEQAELEAVIAEGQAALDAYYEDSERVEQFMELARK